MFRQADPGNQPLLEDVRAYIGKKRKNNKHLVGIKPSYIVRNV